MTSQTPVWFITAAGSGFGHYMALDALSRGHHVIASSRSVSKLEPLREKGATIVALDVTAPFEQLEQAAKEANDKYGYITHLVNAAGYVLVGAVEETSPKDDFDTFNTNVFGTLNITKAFLPYLRAGSGHRTICNFGSIASWTGAAGGALYFSTKWAVSGLSEALRDELAPFGIQVTVAEPGYFRTGILNASASVQSAKKMDVYQEGPVGEMRKALASISGNQPGDVVKGCKILNDILTMSGVAEGKEVPMRIALGSDSPPVLRQKIADTAKLLDEWDEITTKTDHDDK